MEYTDAHMIFPRLWLGNRTASMDADFLRENNIKVVFNCTKDLPFAHSVPRQYRVPVDDNLEPVEIKNLEKWAPEIMYKLLSEYSAGHTVLVHCFAGRQRSAAIVAMFIILKTGRSVDEAMAFIRHKRPVAFFPGPNFEPAIRGFEKMARAYIRPARV
jgi:protein-tyrosine phosphatase